MKCPELKMTVCKYIYFMLTLQALKFPSVCLNRHILALEQLQLEISRLLLSTTATVPVCCC